jgi:enoyl-CoA hydratase
MSTEPSTSAEASPPIVEIDRRDGVMVITLNRPALRNAVNVELAQRLAAAVDELDTDPTLRVAVITGAGGNFCSGMDLKAYLHGERATLPGRGFAGITQRPPVKPTIAAVEGYAVAGGCEIALSCDLIVAGTSAQFGLAEVKRGLVAAGGGLLRLPQRIPRAIALELAMTGRFLTSARALEIGLINERVADGAALDHARALAVEVAANAPLAVAAAKRIVVESPGWPAAEQWDRQIAITSGVNSTEDAREGALAFREKRAPVWRGV